MEKNNNYFSDLNELFLQAKREEQIDVPSQTKNAVREMLKYKISEMKGQAEATSSRPDFMSMFRRWKFPMIGIPAAMATLVLMVYAATNLPLIIPKDEPEMILAENTQKEEVLPINIAEKDKAFFRRVTEMKQTERNDEDKEIELLVLNINDMGKGPITEATRDLRHTKKLVANVPDSNKTQNPDVYIYADLPKPELETYSPGTENAPNQTYKPDPIVDVKDPPKVPETTYPGGSGSNDASDDDTQSSDDPPATNEPDTSADTSQPEESTFIPPMDTPAETSDSVESVDDGDAPDSTFIPPADTSQPESNDANDTYVAYVEPSVDPVTPVTAVESAMVATQPITTMQETYAAKEHTFIGQETTTYPVYYFSDTQLTTTPAFNESLLDNISAKIDPKSMYVYYETDKKVVVEMEVDSETKWYLFEEINGVWTLQKYEREITEDVLK